MFDGGCSGFFWGAESGGAFDTDGGRTLVGFVGVVVRSALFNGCCAHFFTNDETQGSVRFGSVRLQEFLDAHLMAAFLVLQQVGAPHPQDVMCGLGSVVPAARGTTSGTTPSYPGTSHGPCGPT